MMNTIGLIYNEQNRDIQGFVEHLMADLKLCLKRFGSTHTIGAPNETSSLIAIISNDDFGDLEFVNRCKTSSQSDGNMLIVTDYILPERLETLGFNQPILLWDKVYETSEIRLFRRDSSSGSESYWEKLTDIAIEINQGEKIVDTHEKKPFIYLSQVDITQNVNRDNIRRDLSDLGYEVLPNEAISSNYPKSIDQLKEWFLASNLIIHIIPPVYNTFFVSQHLSLAEHQCNISAQMINSGRVNTKRIIWIPSGYEISDEENQIFVERIQRDTDQSLNTMVLKSSIEDLKRTYRHILSNPDEITIPSANDIDVYLIHDSKSNGLVGDIDRSLKEKKLNVSISTSGITYNQHLSNLAKAKNVVLCYSSENKGWLDVKVKDILKSRGIGRFMPFSRVILFDATKGLTQQSYPGIITNIVANPSDVAGVLAG